MAEKRLNHAANTSVNTIDLCGLRCPHLLINVIAALRSLAPGEKLRIRATDLNAPSSITAWSRQSGHKLLDLYQEGECFVFLLQRNPMKVAISEEEQVAPAQKEDGPELSAFR